MNGVFFDRLLMLQAKNNNAKAAEKTAANGRPFASLLAAQMDAPIKGNAVSSSSYTLSNSGAYAPVLNTLTAGDTAGDTAEGIAVKAVTDTVEDKDSMKSLLLMLCYMMCANATGGSSDTGGMGSMMTYIMTALAGLMKDNTGLINNSAVNRASVDVAGTVSNLPAGTKGPAIVQSALTRLGDPYSKSKRGTGNYVDCSYLAKWAYAQAGVSIPGTSVAQAKYCYDNGYTISKSELKPGDLVFWSRTSCHCGRWNEIHHVGIYAGDNKVIEAKSSAGKVVLDELWGENGGDWKIVMYARPHI